MIPRRGEKSRQLTRIGLLIARNGELQQQERTSSGPQAPKSIRDLPYDPYSEYCRANL
jgi:hypothetical protein